MTAYVVSYDLRQPGRNYQPVWDYLGRIGRRALESFWLVDTPLNAIQLCDALRGLSDQNDLIVVIELGPLWGASPNLNSAALQWLHLRRP